MRAIFTILSTVVSLLCSADCGCGAADLVLLHHLHDGSTESNVYDMWPTNEVDFTIIEGEHLTVYGNWTGDYGCVGEQTIQFNGTEIYENEISAPGEYSIHFEGLGISWFVLHLEVVPATTVLVPDLPSNNTNGPLLVNSLVQDRLMFTETAFQEGQLLLTSVSGQIMWSWSGIAWTQPGGLDVSGLSSGLYVVTLRGPDAVRTQRFIKQ